jgi:sulfite exporter TauE/SafE
MASDFAAGDCIPLCLTALSVGVIHTILGPDHYVPFVAMSRAGGWSAAKTLRLTLACGLGHVAGSVLIGAIGLLLGVAVMRLEAAEAFRGDMAAWLLIGFGAASLAAALVRSVGGVHPAAHAVDAAGGTRDAGRPSVWTPWLLFLVFVFGPCEPLVPLLMYPAAKADAFAVAAVVVTFALATLATMAAAVMAMRHGLSWAHAPVLGRGGHVLAGAAIMACGVLMKLGL